ncbi:MAG: c-type cytochrome biogenesis protein CcmI [Limnohabitans sp.]|jgi:cytochrome c-type biogenesis protein CcmH|nr:c-type cytochrome biogenesis protein CcmI [Limnohabitans sp.]
MNAVQIFLLLALVLTLVVLAVLWRVLWQATRPVAQSQEREQVLSHVAVYREQLAELERELAQGSLDQAGFDLSHQELTQRLLEDAPPPQSSAAPTPATNKRPKLLLAGIAVLIPLMAFSAYFLVGTPMALDPQLSAQAHGDEQLTPERLASMADQLAERLQNEPNNAEGWVMLGRIQRALARYDEADLALQKSLALARNDDVMIERAEVLAQKNNGNFKGEPWAIINAVLKVDPTHGNALLLAGSAAFSEGRFKEALAYWERVKASLPPASPDAAALAEAIDQARERLGMPPLSPATNMANAPASAGVLTAKPASDGTERITGRVSIDPALAAQVSPQDIVFIYANAAEGPRMPLAIIRTTVDKLPYDFVLDDSLAMNPQMKLSQVTSVMVRARISKTGNAMPQPGDFGASVGPVTPGSADELKLNISKAFQ